jgi:hypothetical protein
MSDAIVAAIEEHRRALALVQALEKRRGIWGIEDDLAAAKQARERATLRLANIRPRDLDSAATWLAYLTSLGSEGPSLAQIAAVCAIKAKIVRPQVVRGPDRWFQQGR